MCLGIPGEIVALAENDLATVSVAGVERQISVALLADEVVALGDWVLIHVGFAMSKIDQAEAEATLAQIQKLGQVYEDEIAAFQGTGQP